MGRTAELERWDVVLPGGGGEPGEKGGGEVHQVAAGEHVEQAGQEEGGQQHW